jgi:hypothetical protein
MPTHLEEGPLRPPRPLAVSGKNLGEGHSTENHENTTHQIAEM